MGSIGYFGIEQFMLIVIVVYIIINGICILKSRKFNVAREFIKFMFLVYFFGVLSYTMGHTYSDLQERMSLSSINFVPIIETIKMFTQGDLNNAIYQVGGNFIMFIPLGMFLVILYKECNNILRVGVVSFMCTFLIEFNQWIGGRGADVDDLIINTLGGVAGYLIYKLLEKAVKKVNLFRMILEKSSNEKSAIKGVLVVAIPVYLFINGIYQVSNYLNIKNNAIDISSVVSMLAQEGKEVLIEEKMEWGKIYISTDNDEGYYMNSYYEKDGNYFPSEDEKINNNLENKEEAYKDDKGNFIVPDNIYSDSNGGESLEGGYFYIKVPIGSIVTFSNGDKKVSMKVDKEMLYQDIKLEELELRFYEADKIKIEVE